VNLRERVQLLWRDKNKSLLSHGNAAYEWVDPQDWRVAEVRLLHQVAEYGADPHENLLIEGDALHALTALSNLPEYRARYLGHIKLCYIDPPFNTGQAFVNFKDSLENSIYLTMLRDRVKQVKELLAPEGTVWLHLDDGQVHHARCVMDETFGADNWIGTVIWEKTDSPRMDAGKFSGRHDTILVYRKTGAAKLNWLPATRSYANRTDEEGFRYYLKPLRAMGGQGSTREARPTLYYPLTDPDGGTVYPILPDGKDGAWRWNRDKVAKDAHLIQWVRGRKGWNPYFRIYEKPDAERPPETIWPFQEVGSTRNSAAEIKNLLGGKTFATPKPEALIERIIHLATQKGDIVLDCFAGSGTTAAVAHKMGRRWVAVELMPATVEDYILPRLAQVVAGTDLGGITEQITEVLEGDLPEGMKPADVKRAASVLADLYEYGSFSELPTVKRQAAPLAHVAAILDEHPDAYAALVRHLALQMRAAGKTRKEVTRKWDGGAGYSHLQVGPSMFEDANGTIVLADWATNGELAEAVAAQMRFPFAPDGPFAGTKNRSRLAVIDGVLSLSLVDYLLGASEPDHSLIIVAQALELGAEEYVRAKRKGSRARKVPRDLAYISRNTVRVVFTPASDGANGIGGQGDTPE